GGRDLHPVEGAVVPGAAGQRGPAADRHRPRPALAGTALGALAGARGPWLLPRADRAADAPMGPGDARGSLRPPGAGAGAYRRHHRARRRGRAEPDRGARHPGAERRSGADDGASRPAAPPPGGAPRLHRRPGLAGAWRHDGGGCGGAALARPRRAGGPDAAGAGGAQHLGERDPHPEAPAAEAGRDLAARHLGEPHAAVGGRLPQGGLDGNHSLAGQLPHRPDARRTDGCLLPRPAARIRVERPRMGRARRLSPHGADGCRLPRAV
ncbi:MAG: putative membrane protein, partial [uncultured Craurococcus sp.]